MIRGRLAMIAAVLVALGCKAAPSRLDRSPSDTLRRSVHEGLSIRLPAGWAACDTSYWVNEFFSVFLIARNAAAGSVAPHDSMIPIDRGYMVACNTMVLRNQLPPGAIVVLFSQVSGGPPHSYEWFLQYRADTVGDSLATRLDSLGARWRYDEGISTFSVGIQKWGNSWNIQAYARGWPSETDRRAVENVFASTSFPALPIVLRQQALRLAYARLPTEARASGLPAVPGYSRSGHDPCETPEGMQVLIQEDLFDVSVGMGDALRRTMVTRRDSNFVVTFQMGASDSPPTSKKWSYSVSPAGAVAPLEQP